MLRRLHQNLAHPSKEDLVRNLKWGGATAEVIEAAKSMKCASCAKEQRTKAVRPGRLAEVGDFNSSIALDFLHIRDANKKGYWFLSCVDMATTYHVVGHVPSRKPEVVAQIFNDIWVTPFGTPRQVCIDQDGGFRAHFQDMVEKYGAFITSAAGQAPWQHGRCERQGGWLEEIARRTMNSMTTEGLDDMKLLMSCCCGAKNTLRRRAGYSPAQWVFGAEPRLESDFLEESHPTSMLNTPSESMAKRLKMRTEARVAFIRMQTCDVLRRAALSRVRVKRAPAEAGSYVYWRRRPNGPSRPGLWKGPGILRWTLGLASIHNTLRSCKCVCNLPNYICNRLMYICKLRKWVSKCFILPK